MFRPKKEKFIRFVTCTTCGGKGIKGIGGRGPSVIVIKSIRVRKKK